MEELAEQMMESMPSLPNTPSNPFGQPTLTASQQIANLVAAMQQFQQMTPAQLSAQNALLQQQLHPNPLSIGQAPPGPWQPYIDPATVAPWDSVAVGQLLRQNGQTTLAAFNLPLVAFQGATSFPAAPPPGFNVRLGPTIGYRPATRGWRVGDPIDNLTARGNVPSWDAVRERFWKNEARFNSDNYKEANLARMRQGLAPQFINPLTGQLESMELHHNPPQREGGLFEFEPVSPADHRLVDPFRR